ncbi:rod shape-determining protein RodA [Candidatus Falkowbacteria bacterium]|nr:rod shape-determining protein RodA [Candidatus Falkowbacteria bacterium]
MFPKITNFLKHFDWILFLLAFLLVVIGLVFQYSLILNSQAVDFSPFYKQLIAFGLALVLFFSLSYFDFRWFRNYAYLFYALSIISLALLPFFGQALRGTRGWFIFGPISFQPVELAKIFVIIFLAKFFSDRLKKTPVIPFKKIILSCFFVLIPFVLVILQPDLGSGLLLFGVWFLLFFVVNKKRRHLFIIILLMIAVSVSAWFFLLENYQKERVLTFLSPARDPLGVGYQVNQSIIAAGSGKIFGRGLGLGPQSQLRFLPDSSTDFIFSVVAEEFGFFGVVIVIGLFFLLLWRIVSYSKIAYSNFSSLLILGILALVFLQVFVNIGMNIGLFPVAGIPLPFLSYGNSSLVAFFIALGILESIKVHKVKSSEF